MKKKPLGFTLVELMAALAIITVSLTVVIPAFSTQIKSINTSLSTNELLGIFQFARSSALKRNSFITLCPTNNQVECSDDWRDPIIVFLDPEKVETISSESQILRIFQPISSGDILLGSISLGRKYFQYNSQGYTNGTAGNLIYCPKDKDIRFARQLVVSLQGRPRLSPDTDDDGIIEDRNGNDLSCE